MLFSRSGVSEGVLMYLTEGGPWPDPPVQRLASSRSEPTSGLITSFPSRRATKLSGVQPTDLSKITIERDGSPAGQRLIYETILSLSGWASPGRGFETGSAAWGARLDLCVAGACCYASYQIEAAMCSERLGSAKAQLHMHAGCMSAAGVNWADRDTAGDTSALEICQGKRDWDFPF